MSPRPQPQPAPQDTGHRSRDPGRPACAGLVPARTPDLGFITSSSLKSLPLSCPHTEARQPVRVSGQAPGKAPTPVAVLPRALPRPPRLGAFPPPASSSPPAPARPAHCPSSPGLRTLRPPLNPHKQTLGWAQGPSSQRPVPSARKPLCRSGEAPSFRKLPLASAPPALCGPFGHPAGRAQHETRCPPAG